MIPQEIEKLLCEHFDYPAIIYVQVATLSSQGPDLRTMGLFDFRSGKPLLLTNTASHKWFQLQHNPCITILLLNNAKNVQIIARGKATLLTDPKLMEHYWKITPPQAQVTYHHRDPEGNFTPLTNTSISASPPDNFGIIEVTPTAWETLEIDKENYHASHRYLFERNNDGWHNKRLNAI